MTTIRRPLVAAALAAAIILGTASPAMAHQRQLREVKESLARFHSNAYAQRQGFGLATDVNGISCIEDPQNTGAMGYHYGNPTLVGDGEIDAFRPEVFLYERRRGDLHLTAIEYIVIKSAWLQQHHDAPELFGQEFMVVEAPNRYGLPTFYMLHAWLWKDNPNGRFAPYNPTVHCP